MSILTAQFEKSQSLHEQIADYLRVRLVAGEFPPGSQLPSTHVLAAAWHTAPRTVHLALVALEKEGLLVRRHGKGTFVRKREARLTCVGIYYPEDVFGRSLYLQSLHAALQTELRARGIESDVWLDPRPIEQRDTAWPSFTHAVGQREFQALIVPVTDREHLRWQTKLPLPLAVQGGEPPLPNRVGHDLKQFASLSLRALADQGCRTVGLITPMATTPRPGDPRPTHDSFFAHFTDLSRDLGLTIKNQWIRVTRYEDDLRGRSLDSFGYEQFHELWRQRERPAGLVIYEDVTARGVITALLEESVRVPAELKLVLHKNEAIELLCPMPATFVVSSERAVARALLTQVEKQFRGERCEPIDIGFRLVAHRGNNR